MSAGLWRRLRRHPSGVVGAVILAAFLLMALIGPLLTPHDPDRGDLRLRFVPPAWHEGGDWRYPLGTDNLGRDILSRIVWGARISLTVGFVTVLVSAAVGTALGAVAGYRGGWFDALVSRLAEWLLAFPLLVFAIGMMAALGPGMTNLIIALSFKGWVTFFRLVRGDILVEKNREYVEAARAIGRSDLAIVARELLPNLVHTVFVVATLRLGIMIIAESSLSFLGFGVEPSLPAWGSMISGGKNHLTTAWWVSVWPGCALLLLVMAVNLLGEALRDLLDPRAKNTA